VIDTRETNELLPNGRNPMSLAALVPGVVPQGGSQSNPNGQNPFAWGNCQIGGGFANQSATYLDGTPVNTAPRNLYTERSRGFENPLPGCPYPSKVFGHEGWKKGTSARRQHGVLWHG
jgi:hypothetical protein